MYLLRWPTLVLSQTSSPGNLDKMQILTLLIVQGPSWGQSLHLNKLLGDTNAAEWRTTPCITRI